MDEKVHYMSAKYNMNYAKTVCGIMNRENLVTTDDRNLLEVTCEKCLMLLDGKP